eukprot:TRINITY_DN1149_c0_g3_i3.p1 TRINITY_DN1149_c0_g3~~TRINITY_DN1149_c0_g3_i3.p1  ORF type:complete len:311 (-),score=57.21 TRINITY_DN1149_c0_g3_i3:1192-2124(-)
MCCGQNSSRQDGARRSSGCCGGKACCCCCCSKRGASICFSLIGLILATGVIVPPLWIYLHDQDYSKIFPVFNLARDYLGKINENNAEVEGGPPTSPAESPGIKNLSNATVNETDSSLKSSEKYRLAIFQLLDDTEEQIPLLAFFSFCVGCLNVPLDIFLFFGAVFRSPCALIPWIFFTIIEIILIGIPFIIFSGLISLYLAAQFHLYIEAGLILGVIVTLFFLSLSSWLTVLRCYKSFGKSPSYLLPDFQSTGDSQLTQPLLPPPESRSHGYQLGQYPQYYPPHGGGQSSRQLPSAPPPSSSHALYPSLS